MYKGDVYQSLKWCSSLGCFDWKKARKLNSMLNLQAPNRKPWIFWTSFDLWWLQVPISLRFKKIEEKISVSNTNWLGQVMNYCHINKILFISGIMRDLILQRNTTHLFTPLQTSTHPHTPLTHIQSYTHPHPTHPNTHNKIRCDIFNFYLFWKTLIWMDWLLRTYFCEWVWRHNARALKLWCVKCRNL